MLERDHVAEIDRVLRGVDTGRDPVVANSWQRCVDAYGMDPTRRDPAHILPETVLREHVAQSERLIATARSGLQSLFQHVAGQNYVLLLADADGVCVDFFGDRTFEDDLRAAGLYLGYKWTEDLAGTNGVGSCLVTGAPVTIHQGDHFSLTHTPLSCTAAPIYDTQGALSAVLDVSLLRAPSPKSSQNLAMTLVTNATRRVEMANLMASARRDWVLRLARSPEFLDVDPEAALALDGAGRIVGMTSGAQRLLDPAQTQSLIGARLEDWFEASVDDLPAFMRGRPTDERILHLRDGRALFGHAIAPQVPRTRAALPRPEADLPAALTSFAGPDSALQALLRQAARLAQTDVPLLLTGETGTGKEKLARAIHMAAPGSRGFHSLSGSSPAAIAALSDCAPGTLFLRRVADLSAPAQAGLVSLLEERRDLRVIAACPCPPADLARHVRGDLLHRLAGATLALPALRHRADMDWLIDRLLRRISSDNIRLSPLARGELKSRAWPGNIRELHHTLTSAAALCEGRVIDLPDLPPPVLPPPVLAHQSPGALEESDLEQLLVACDWNMSQVARRLGVNRSTVLRRMRKAGLSPPA